MTIPEQLFEIICVFKYFLCVAILICIIYLTRKPNRVNPFTGRLVNQGAEDNGMQLVHNQQLDEIKSQGIQAIHSASGTDKEHNVVAYRNHFVGINMHQDSSKPFESMRFLKHSHLRTSTEDASKSVDELLAGKRDSYISMRKAAALAIIEMLEVQFSYGKIAEENKILEFTMKSSDEMDEEAETSHLLYAETIIQSFKPIAPSPYYANYRTHNKSELKCQELANAVTANANAAILDLHDARDNFWLGLKIVC